MKMKLYGCISCYKTKSVYIFNTVFLFSLKSLLKYGCLRNQDIYVTL